jgi:hypothetical protein
MFHSPDFIDLLAVLGLLLIVLSQIAGIVVSAILLRRKAGAGATFALVGFGALLIVGVCGQIYSILIFPSMLRSATLGALTTAEILYPCLNGLFMTVGFGLLVFGIWRLGQKATSAVEEAVPMENQEAEQE